MLNIKPRNKENEMNKSSAMILLSAAILVFPSISSAHASIAGMSSHAGLLHPFTGLDHLLAMFAVGLWASKLGGRAVWMLPTAFVSAIIVGGLIGVSGIDIPGVRAGIVASLLIFGFLLAADVKLPVVTGSLAVSFFGLFHGQAHGAEMSATLSVLPYVAGFTVATILLQVAGVASFRLMQLLHAEMVARLFGGGITLAGVYMAAV